MFFRYVCLDVPEIVKCGSFLFSTNPSSCITCPTVVVLNPFCLAVSTYFVGKMTGSE